MFLLGIVRARWKLLNKDGERGGGRERESMAKGSWENES